mmetsp:Transcript_18685/g.37896  ORF Transcript_18685/g.37896 Transcript_18685/m.37896 type:complete len:213 (-) Transcript_18685:239-877(-)
MLTQPPDIYQLPLFLDVKEDSPHLVINSEYEGNVLTPMRAPWQSFGWEDFPALTASLEEERKYLRANYGPERSPRDSTEEAISAGPTRKAASRNRGGKSVSFSCLEIREHSVTVGDHPCASALPLTLSWAHSPASTVVEIDAFEQNRMGHRRSGSDIRMSYAERKNRLRNIAGLKEADIVKAERRLAFQKGFESSLRRIDRVSSMQLSSCHL